MNDEELQKLRQRMRENLAADPERARRLVLTTVGAHLAGRGIELEGDDDVSEEDRDALAQGYVAGTVGELASKPPWYTDLPLLGRLFRALRHMRSNKQEGS